MTTQATRSNSAESPWAFSRCYDPEFKNAVAGEIDELRALPANWDQFGAPPIDPAVIDAARTFVAKLPEGIATRPEVVPLPSGHLQFEWCDGPKSLELEFEPGQRIRYLKWDSELGIDEEDCFSAADLQKACELIHWFMCGTYK